MSGIDTGDTAWMLVGHGAGAAHDPGAGPVLRRPRAREEHAEHVHDVHRGDRHRGGHLDGDRLLVRLRRRQRDHRRLRLRVAERRRRSRRGRTRRFPHLLFFAFQGTFCIITVALVSGAVVERMRFGAFMVFAALWSVLVYAVLAHWAFGPGWLFNGGTLDFAGGVAVEMASGFSALAAALVVGARKDYGRQALLPHNAVYVLLGRRPAVVRLVRLQRRQRLRHGPEQHPGLREHAPVPGRRAGHLVHARPDPRPHGHGDRRGDGDHRRLRADHARRRIRQPRMGAGARGRGRAAVPRR